MSHCTDSQLTADCDKLRILLKQILEQATFDLGEVDQNNDTITTTYSRHPEDLVGPDDLRELLNIAPTNLINQSQAKLSHPVVDTASLNTMHDILRRLFNQYTDLGRDCIVHYFPAFNSSSISSTLRPDHLREHKRESTIPNFALGLIKSAAILGVGHVVSLLRTWIEGKPFKYHISAILHGAHVTHDIDLCNGIRVMKLPLSSDKLPPSFPNSTSHDITRHLGRSVVSIACDVTPAILPAQHQSRSGSPFSFNTPFGDTSSETLYQAISLVCNCYIDVTIIWEEYDGSNSLISFGDDGMFAYGPARELPKTPSSSTKDGSTGAWTAKCADDLGADLSQVDLVRAWSILPSLEHQKNSNRRFNVALTRWLSCMRPDSEFTDQYIDLRIALEALYLDSSQGELGFRLGTTCAWHLGNNFEDRRVIQDNLVKFYRVASTVIHGGKSTKHQSAEQWLGEAKDLCRRGILKVTEEQNRPNWRHVILGMEAEDQS